MNILVCDDDKVFADRLSMEIQRMASKIGKKVCIKCVCVLDELSKLNLALIDIAFLDIDLGKMNGMALARQMRAVRNDVILIFVTNYIEYSLEGYEVQAFRYILKRELNQKLPLYFSQAVMAYYTSRKYIRISCDGEEIDVFPGNLIYVETEQRHLLLHLCTDKRRELRTHLTMNEMSKMLEQYGFLRIHQSYVINMAYIKRLQSTGVSLQNGTDLPISARNYRNLKQQYLQWKGRKGWNIG